MSEQAAAEVVQQVAPPTEAKVFDNSFVTVDYTNHLPAAMNGQGSSQLVLTVPVNHHTCILGEKQWVADKNGDQYVFQTGTFGACQGEVTLDLKNQANAPAMKLRVSRGLCRNDYFVQDNNGVVMARSKEPTLVQRLLNVFAGPFVGYTILTGVDAKEVERFVIRIPGYIKCPELCDPYCKAICKCDLAVCLPECKAVCAMQCEQCKLKCVKCLDCKAQCEECKLKCVKCLDCKAKCDECKLKCETCVVDCTARCNKCKALCLECKIPFHEELLLWRPWDLEPSHWVTKIEFDGFVNLCGQVLPDYTVKVNFPAGADVGDRAVLLALAFYADNHIMSHRPTIYPPHLLHNKK